MRVYTVSNPGYSVMTDNLVASGLRFGIDVEVVTWDSDCDAPVAGAGVSGSFQLYGTDLLTTPVVGLKKHCKPFEFHGVKITGNPEFNRLMIFKLRTIRENFLALNLPFLYLDSDCVIMNDFREWVYKSAKSPVSFQCGSEKSRFPWPHRIGMGVVCGVRKCDWMDEFFSEPDDCRTGDEMLVNYRAWKAPLEISQQLGTLPSGLFVLGCSRCNGASFVYHANYCIGMEAKISRLKESGGWFL
jgi:hypothetical protein